MAGLERRGHPLKGIEGSEVDVLAALSRFADGAPPDRRYVDAVAHARSCRAKHAAADAKAKQQLVQDASRATWLLLQTEVDFMYLRAMIALPAKTSWARDRSSRMRKLGDLLFFKSYELPTRLYPL